MKKKVLVSSPSSPHYVLSMLTKRNDDSLIAKSWVGYKPHHVTIDIKSSVTIASAGRHCSGVQ
jgi:hypothetical protein